MRKAGDALDSFSPETIQLMAADAGVSKKPEQISSVHMFLDEGKMGGINDGDETLYIHSGGDTLKKSVPGMGNPIKGAPSGTKVLQDGPLEQLEQLRQQINEHRLRKHHQKYGTGNLAGL